MQTDEIIGFCETLLVMVENLRYEIEKAKIEAEERFDKETEVK